MAFKKTFVLSDESVNSYGFVVLTAGIRLENAKQNLPCFYDHKTWEVPLGHWENLRIADGKLIGDLIINGDNDREKNYINKIENGDIKGASVGLDPITWTEDPMFLKQGQTRPTLQDSDLFEASITPLPGNTAALALKHEGNLVTLNNGNSKNIIPQLKQEINMKAIALKLGLQETATENEILAAIGGIQLSNTQSETFRKDVLDGAGEGLKDEAKEIFVTLSKTNAAQALKYAASQKETVAEPVTEVKKVVKDVKLSSLIQNAKGVAQATEADEECYDYLQKKNPVELKRIHAEEPDKYAQLVKAYGEGKRYTGK